MTTINASQRFLAVAAGVAAFVLASTSAGRVAAADPTPPAGPTAQVKIDNFTFGPVELTVAAGTTVTWINRDDIPHTVVSVDKVFKSSALDTDESFTYTFTQPGTYPYFCSIHPKMTGKVVVQ
jgi:amicyanin